MNERDELASKIVGRGIGRTHINHGDALGIADKLIDAGYRNAPQAPVLNFINARAEYVQAARNSRGDDIDADYHRWQGHMEARRQLAQALGYTVPYEPGDKTEPKAKEAQK